MKRVLGWIFNRWTLAAVLLLALALVVWIVGPLVAIGTLRPLETETARWMAIGAMVLAALLQAAWRAWRQRRGNAAVVQQLVAAPPAEHGDPDLAAVRERFERALATLKRARFGAGTGWAARLRMLAGGRYLYQLPWYLIIGAPGSGKTTALRHAGLTFPLGSELGDHAVRGVGGTRHCDWWFTDRAVLIDTAGRFTTQDSDARADGATWNGFLGLLKSSRPRQPLNGVLVTVSVTDLLATAPERERYAATVRQRLDELDQRLGVRLPVYLLVTKCDLLPGFVESFDTLDKAQRLAAWGHTAPDTGTLTAPAFGTAFDALSQRLVDGLVQRLQAEGDGARRARLYAFPLQFAALREPLEGFVGAAFASSAFEAGAWLRGTYFVSGTQEGTPIDRLLGGLARRFRLERAAVPPLQSAGRSYFLQRLLGDVVFAESALAGVDRRWERRRAGAVLAGYAAVAALCAGLLTAWGVSWFHNRAYVAQVAERADGVRRLVQSTPNRNSPELAPIEPALAATQALARSPGTDGSPPADRWTLGFGLFQGDKLDSAAQAAYRRMLADAFLPRLALRIEDQLRQGDTPETQYEALKAYLMMRDPQHFDAAALKAYVQADWDARLRELSAREREQLGRDLDALLAQGVVTSPIAEDRGVVDAARARLAHMGLPERVYSRLRQSGVGADIPAFSVARAAGPTAGLVYTRASGQSLQQGVPGLFTYDGYHKAFDGAVDAVAAQLADEEPWVMGKAADAAPSTLRDASLGDAVRRLYLNEYAALWEAFIADLRMLPMTSPTQAVQMARTLSAPDNPLSPLVKALSRETTLGRNAAERDLIDKAGDKVRDVVQASATKFTGKLAGKLGTAPPAALAAPPIESIVDDRFAALRLQATAPAGGGKAPVDETVALLGELHLFLTSVETALQGGQPAPPSPVPNRVKAEAALKPEPLRSMLDTLGKGSARVAQVQLRGALGQEVQSQVGEFCRQALAGRYPLDRASLRDATQADFAAVFAPGGKVDKLFQDKLGPYVDTSTRPWRFRPVEGTPLGDDAGQLPQFQRAAVIRDTFFAGGQQPALKLEFKPVEMDPAIAQFILDIDGQMVRYAHGPQIPTTVQWPGPRGSGQVRVQVLPPGLANGIVTDGPWALLRLFDRTDRVKLEPGAAPERFKAVFDLDGRKAVFEVTASSVRNPFRLPELNEFSCPAGL